MSSSFPWSTDIYPTYVCTHVLHLMPVYISCSKDLFSWQLQIRCSVYRYITFSSPIKNKQTKKKLLTEHHALIWTHFEIFFAMSWNYSFNHPVENWAILAPSKLSNEHGNNMCSNLFDCRLPASCGSPDKSLLQSGRLIYYRYRFDTACNKSWKMQSHYSLTEWDII